MKKILTSLSIGLLIGLIPAAFAVSKLFSDVPSDTWYSNAVQSLSEKGIIEGYPDGTFRPSEKVNRAELAVILDRSLTYLENNTINKNVFSVSGADQTLNVSNISFGSIGLPTDNPNYRHLVNIDLGGPVLEIFFHNKIDESTTLDLQYGQIGDDLTYGANLVSYTGFEGESENLCETPSGFPPNASKSGTFTIESYSLDDDLMIKNIEGSITINLAKCTIPELNIENKDVTLTGNFNK